MTHRKLLRKSEVIYAHSKSNDDLFIMFNLDDRVVAGGACPAPPQEILTQYMTELRKSPNDNTLRERTIRHVQGMNPAPAALEDLSTALRTATLCMITPALSLLAAL